MLLEALKGKNRKRPPVWLMRQAGRYMPSYQKIRASYSLRELFLTPELAAQITLLPVEEFGVDAAILFSDITVIALPLGFSLDFAEGPVISGKICFKGMQTLKPIAEAIRLSKQALRVPLLGFCGGPYTVASYIENGLSLLESITEATIEYIQMQQEAGVDAIQIFDSWAGGLSKEDFQKFAAPYLKRIIEAAKVPVILFMRGSTFRVQELVSLKPDAISFDWEKPLKDLRPQVPMAIQGNLDPDLLFEPLDIVRQKTRELLESMRKDPGFIVNLGHGVKPKTPVEAVRCFVDTVKQFY